MAMQAAKIVTAEELARMGDIGRCELLYGEIVMMAPAFAEHGDIAGEVFGRIWTFVRQNNLGKVYAAETGFILARNPDVVRAPDVAFVRWARIAATPSRGFFDGAPDLAVEVISSADRMSELLAKADMWLGAGTTSVWLVDPIRRRIAAHRKGGFIVEYRAADQLRDEPTLPGFVLKLDDLFGR